MNSNHINYYIYYFIIFNGQDQRKILYKVKIGSFTDIQVYLIKNVHSINIDIL